MIISDIRLARQLWTGSGQGSRRRWVALLTQPTDWAVSEVTKLALNVLVAPDHNDPPTLAASANWRASMNASSVDS